MSNPKILASEFCNDHLTCPTVFENGEELIIVGKVIHYDERVMAKVGNGEAAVAVPRDLLLKAAEMAQRGAEESNQSGT